MKGPFLLGVDVGTVSVRAVLVDAQGQCLRSGSRSYPLVVPRPLWAEQDPTLWWEKGCEAIREALQGSDVNDVAAVGLTGQMHGLVLLDSKGNVLHPAILWCDQRTPAECEELEKSLPEGRVRELTLNPVLPGFTAPKLLWVRRCEPELFARARWFLLPKDYFRYRLTGERVTDPSDASGTSLFEVASGHWSGEILAAAGLRGDWLPRVVQSTAVGSRVSTEAAGPTGLPAGVPVVGGAGDQAAGAVGCGVVSPGQVSVSLGSSGVVFTPVASPARDALGRLHTFCHAAEGMWHLMGVTQAAGLSLRWLREKVLGPPGPSYEELDMEAATAPAGADGLVYLPYLQGERTPHLDPCARGTLVGLTTHHTRAHIVRAVMEGVAMSLLDCLSIMEDLGIKPAEVRFTGGGARSKLWASIVADVFARRVVLLEADEGPAYGAALLAGVGARFFPNVAAACKGAVRLAGAVEPDSLRTEVYRHAYPVFRKLYTRLAPVFPMIGHARGARG
jgi:xylulokinase